MSGLRDALRRRQDLNPLATQIPQVQQPFQTPASSVGLSSPFGHHSPYTPATAVRQYNPQQWGMPAVSPENMLQMHYVQRASPDETEAPAPPPYSPPRSRGPMTISPDEASPAHRISPVVHRPSPEPQAAPIFPPPPGTRSRALSRDRPTPLFNLGAFSRRNAGPDPNRVSPPASYDHVGASRAQAQLPVEHAAGPRGYAQMTVEQVQQQVDRYDSPARPPASRRAASTGAIGSSPSTLHSRGLSTARWEPGMPLPPPPPGPPPQASLRSQSMTRSPAPVVSPPTRRPQAISTLGPVPPTPAGWIDEDLASRGRSPNRGLQIDTSAAILPPPAEVTSGNSGGSSSASGGNSAGNSAGLSRAPAVRGEPRSIRERRSESRTGRKPVPEEFSNNPWADAITPSDITVPPMTVLGRRPTITKSTPRSARSLHGIETPNSARTAGQNTPTLAALGTESRGGTPRPPLSSHHLDSRPPSSSDHTESRPHSSSNRIEAPTPPFSPDNYHPSYQNSFAAVPPRSLPTPPPQTRRSESSTRATSHVHHSSSKEHGLPARSPSRTPAVQSAKNSPVSDFCLDAIQRHNLFAQQEADADTDEERVCLFAEFIVSESRLRREKYASAISAMGSEILELTRDLFRPYSRAEKEVMKTTTSRRASNESDFRPERSGKMPAAQADSQPDSRPSSATGVRSTSPPGDSPYYNNNYKPSLSPIASMAASEVPDESSSRGRPSIRWWELGHSGPASPTSKLERSKRESKYMGVPREARESLQWETSSHPSSSDPTVAGPSSRTSYGPSEYPPEKTGWHEELTSPPLGKTPTSASFRPYSPVPPATPNPRHLDVSRLVTLPPPYPRHHPAVNNNHPDLTDIRNAVRALSDFSEVEATKQRFLTVDKQMQDTATSAATSRRHSLRGRIQREIEAGTMSYADAAKAEAESTTLEAETSKAESKASFELFQKSVVAPLNDLLMKRVHRATALFSQLQSQLFADAEKQNPNLPQEEGDEQPELLEKLTLLKWIFEAREGLHREVYDLLSDRNDRYKEMVISPYRLAKNDAKIKNAEQFFAADAKKRKSEYETEALTRTVEFMDIVESNVVRGVEVQLGAFWDIAPSLRQITEKVPKNLSRDFGIVIPREEYEENPDYATWPLQYLYHLLEHGEKSTYQFIESQVNLLCLLHEVKSAVAAARGRVDEAESEGQEGHQEAVREGMAREEQRLTDDLKEKVRCVEELWGSALGLEFEGVKERVKLFLISESGWEGMEDQE